SEIVYRKPKNKWLEKARVILAITGKDILEAVKNKSVISTILSALFIVVAYRFIPILSRGSDPPVVFIYSQVETEIVKKLETSDTLTVYTGYETLEAMQRRLADWDVPAIGVSIPGDMGTDLSMDGVVMDGYILNWTSDEDDNELISLVEDEFTELLDRPVRLDNEGHTVYPWPESDGISTWMGLSAVFAVSMIGITLIPHLMLEEKKSRTIDFLMVSPATATDLTIAKALTGAFYALLGGIIVISIYSYTVVQWWLVPFLFLVGISFLIGFGLIMGLMIKDRSQLTLVGFFIFIPLFLPVMLSLMSPLFPDALITVFKLVPTTVLFNLFRIVLSGSGNFSAITVIWYLAYLLAWGVGVLMIVAVLVRRLDRRDSMYGLETRSTGADAHIQNRQISTPGPIITEETGSELAVPFERVKPAPIIAIALKDIREAINNKLFVSILIGTGFIVLSQSAMQNFVISRSRAPVMLIYDRGNSSILQELDQQPDTHVAVVDSLSIVEEAITDMPSKDLGLILPEDFDEIALSQEEIVLEGLYAHWFDLKDIDKVREDFETL
ncbi:MAG: ABC transporter permease, partial [Gammaproteobacteria bacterium]|nr:ABC transporter permease [Gammaproteobacteria bacterium]